MGNGSSGPYGPTPNGDRNRRTGYGCESSLGTRTEVRSRTPSRMGTRYSYLVYAARMSKPDPSLMASPSLAGRLSAPPSGVEELQHRRRRIQSAIVGGGDKRPAPGDSE